MRQDADVEIILLTLFVINKIQLMWDKRDLGFRKQAATCPACEPKQKGKEAKDTCFATYHVLHVVVD